MINNRIILFLLLILTLMSIVATMPSDAADLHVVLVGDSLKDIDRNGFECSVDLWRREAKRIAAYTGLHLQGVVLEGPHCRVDNVVDYLENMIIGPDDVVILYFAIHGSRLPTKENPWPDLRFSLDQKEVDFDFFNAIIKKKKPRLFLSIADSCNDVDEGIHRTGIERKPLLAEKGDFPTIENSHSFTILMLDHTSSNILEGYEKLFLDYAGTITIAGSIPGQPAIKHLITGGVYTVQFLESLKYYTAFPSNEISWENLLDRAASETHLKLKKVFDPNRALFSHYELHLSPSKALESH